MFASSSPLYISYITATDSEVILQESDVNNDTVKNNNVTKFQKHYLRYNYVIKRLYIQLIFVNY